MKIKNNKYLVYGLALVFVPAILYFISFREASGIIEEPLSTKAATHEAKADNPNKFIELHNDLRTRASESSSGYASGYKLKELRNALQASSTARLSEIYVFTERGPGNVPGRTRGLIVDPDDAAHETWFAGGVGGGIWKTNDAGKTWINKTPDVPNLAISWLVMSESNHSILYAGTGEGYEGALGIKGSGIYKSIDKGESWSLLSSTTLNDDFHMVNRIIVDPDNPDILLAATSNVVNSESDFDSGIFKSIDGGNSWTRKCFGADWVQQIVATPNDFNILYAAIHSKGVYKSIDAGETWSNSSEGLFPDGRIEMAVSAVNTSRLYASVVGSLSGGEADLYVSDNAGATWQVVTEEVTGVDADFLGGQGGYDNTIIAHPYNEDMVYVGGVNLWKFTMKPGTVVEEKQFLGAEEQNTSSFLDLVRFSAPYYDGRIDPGNETVEDFVSVEIRFGSDGMGGYLKQMAHRFTIPVGEGSGVPASDYTYQDYVEVPFQVWDIKNNRQLMVSFRDQQEDGIFNLILRNTNNKDAINNSREYIFMNNIDYDAALPDPGIAVKGGHEFKKLYFIWPVLAEGGTWDEENLPDSKFIIFYDIIEKRLKETTSVTDAYTEFGGNNSFSQVMGSTNQIGVHPDHHNIVPIIWPEEGQMFQLLVAGDGGIYVSLLSETPGEADNSFNIAGLTYNTSQFYAADKAPNISQYVGGMQDNGSWMNFGGDEGSATSSYRRAGFGDGFGCAWNHADPLQIITTSQYGKINKSTNGGGSFNQIGIEIDDIGNGKAPFVSEIENLHSDPNVVFATGISGVWRSTNFGDNWQLAAISNQWSLGLSIKARISHANSHIIWAGNAMRETPSKASLHVSTDEGISFSLVNNYTDRELGSLSGLATHPQLDSTAFALFSFAKGPKILRTDNLGESWYDISGFGAGTSSINGFPDVAVNDLLVMPYDSTIIWAGTEIGIFESSDAGGTWHILNGNMPATSIWDMKIVDKQVVIGTYGRGIWSTTIDELAGQVYLPEIISSQPSLAGELFINVNMQSAFDSTHIYIDDALISKHLQPSETGISSFATNYFASNTGQVYLRSFYNGVPYVSHTFNFESFDYGTAIDSYENDFTSFSNDFTGHGFSEMSYSNFNGRAIHSDHNYLKNAYYQYVLKFPIRVRSSDALINFIEVAIIEPGIEGSTPGTADFNDYVVVQGSLDGITWVNLLDEYDASEASDWESVYNLNDPGSKDLFKFRAINLLETFEANDAILIRFLLVANSVNEGWGWAIDNLKIQSDNVVTGIDAGLDAVIFSVYPNPVTKSFITIVQNNRNEQAMVSLFSLNGQLILNQPLSKTGKTQIELPVVLKDGIYAFIITTGTKSETHKVIIQRNL